MKKRLLLSFMALLTASGMWAADGDTFKANTIEGVEMTFTVISEADKTCYVGGRYGGGGYFHFNKWGCYYSK